MQSHLGPTMWKISVSPHSSAHFASSLYVTLDDLKPSDTIDENGIRTIVDYATNEAGKKIKVPFYFHPYSP